MGAGRRLAIRRASRYNERVPTFRILGPLEVLDDDDAQIPLGGQKQRAVLALLLLRANHVVPSDYLVDAIWGETPPRTATTGLQNQIAALRRLLGPSVIEFRAPGYRLHADEESFDFALFERLVAESRGLESPQRAERLREALALWRGDPMPEFAYERFAEADLRSLEERHITTLEDRIDADLACERYTDLVPELESLAARHPLRERLCGQLMLALYHSGRQGDAQQAYHDYRRRLMEELGLEPTPRLQDLMRDIIKSAVPRPRPDRPRPDKEHLEEVAEALLAGQLVPVLGADVGALADGLAQRFGYPDSAGDLTRVAQFVAMTRGEGPLYNELRSLLDASEQPTALHRFFASLPAALRERSLPHQLIVTTSYDLALEQALLDAGEEFDIVSYVASGRDRGRFCHREPSGATHVIDLPNTYATELSLERRTVVLKLHGGIEHEPARDRESFVVTEDDYIGYLARGDVGSAIPVALAAKLRRSHFLFLGYGMREWSLRLVLDRVCASEPFAFASWAVLPQARPLEHKFWQARRVDLLEQPLEDYVHALGAYVGLNGDS
jgi:DNA-binding SARP family transcriptional activator